MDRLIKPSDYAKQMGISRQAVYAKIKKGILTAKNVDGKLYIVNDDSDTSSPDVRENATMTPEQSLPPSDLNRELLEAKNETISVLRETVADLKETSRMVTSTLRSEVELLKEAFSEMKLLYSAQIEQLRIAEQPTGQEAVMDESPDISEPHDVPSDDIDSEVTDDLAWIDLNDFFDEYGMHKKTKREKIAKRLKKLHKKGDRRVDKYNGELVVLMGADFGDIITKKH